jgi:hypothetical protein
VQGIKHSLSRQLPVNGNLRIWEFANLEMYLTDSGEDPKKNISQVLNKHNKNQFS